MPEVQKICIRCRRDCGDRPRVKDPAGRYICKECLTAERPLPIAADPIPVVPPGLSLCPKCQSSIPYGMTLCIQCGFDTASGAQVDTTIGVEEAAVEAPPRGAPAGTKCVKCGYSLKGLKSPVCPECGTISTAATDLRERMRRASRESARNAYLKPIFQFAFGVGLLLAIIFTSDDPRGYAIFYGLQFAIGVPIGVVAFILCCLIWVGIDAPLHLTVLRLVGVYALTDGIGAFVGLAGVPFIPFTVKLAVYVCLLANAMELELPDAALIGVVTWVIKWFVMMAILVYVLEAAIL